MTPIRGDEHQSLRGSSTPTLSRSSRVRTSPTVASASYACRTSAG